MKTFYNKQTEQFESILGREERHKVFEEETKRKQEMTEENKKKLREEKLKKEIEKQSILEKMRLDKLEREAKKRQEQELRAMMPEPTVVSFLQSKFLRNFQDQNNFWWNFNSFQISR